MDSQTPFSFFSLSVGALAAQSSSDLGFLESFETQVFFYFNQGASTERTQRSFVEESEGGGEGKREKMEQNIRKNETFVPLITTQKRSNKITEQSSRKIYQQKLRSFKVLTNHGKFR